MDKNIYAIVANDTKTVKVRFQELNRDTGEMGFNSKKEYTYVTCFDLAVNDIVIVMVGYGPSSVMKPALVTTVDNGVDITPNDETEYKFVMAKVDFETYDFVMQQKKEVEDELAKAYQLNLKKQFAQQFLGGASQSLLEKLGYEVGDSK